MLKDQLIKKISEELQLPEEMVDKIVMWSCKDVHDAFLVPVNYAFAYSLQKYL